MLSLNWYFSFFQFIAANRIKNNDLDLRRIHSHTVVVLSTGILMWAYAFLALFTISSPVPGLVGIACSLIHLLSPLLFRFSANAFLISSIMIGAGMVHQATFSYFTGGFKSQLLIWFGILPMLGGIIAGKKGAIFWCLSTLLCAGLYGALYFTGYQFPYLITDEGMIISHSLLVFGWIFLSTSIIYVLLILNENRERLLQVQGKKIEDLFRVLFHDLASPLSRISIGLSMTKREADQETKQRGLDIAFKAAGSMMDITQNVRKMYQFNKEDMTSDLIYHPLNEAVEYISRIYAGELEKKNLKLQYDFPRHASLKVLVEPISFKNQVLGNALSNAIKFSHPNTSIRIEAKPQSSGQLSLEVHDQGIGIPENIINCLFDLNKKTSRPGTAGESGTGYGMYIMRTFVEMYQGKMAIESGKEAENQTGTCVKFTLRCQGIGGMD